MVSSKTKIAQVLKADKIAETKASVQTFLSSGIVDKTMMEGFAEMGANFSDWSTIQASLGLSDSQLARLKSAHAKYFGSPETPMATDSGKKPNYLLWGGLAVVAILVVRKLLK